mmetsp:Transcript_972/g.1866  ORF Transcript_972/g.1866 Transcript_972/m.1866 type:complete len:206 (-) Transcript_972:1066-1683(-)
MSGKLARSSRLNSLISSASPATHRSRSFWFLASRSRVLCCITMEKQWAGSETLSGTLANSLVSLPATTLTASRKLRAPLLPELLVDAHVTTYLFKSTVMILLLGLPYWPCLISLYPPAAAPRKSAAFIMADRFSSDNRLVFFFSFLRLFAAAWFFNSVSLCSCSLFLSSRRPFTQQSRSSWFFTRRSNVFRSDTTEKQHCGGALS